MKFDCITPEFLTLVFFTAGLTLLFLWWIESRKRRHKCRGIHSLYLFQCKNCHLIFVGEDESEIQTTGRSTGNIRNGDGEESSSLSRCPNCRTWCVRQWIEAGRR